MEAAKKRNEPLDHVLLNGPPGLGKTTLANIIAREMGWKIKTMIGGQLSKVYDTHILFFTLKERMVLFIDEVHRVRKPVQEILYPILEDGKIGGPDGFTLIPLTIIGATTNIGKLDRPFIDRFPLQFQLEYYDLDDLQIIVEANAIKLKLELAKGTSEVISERARGTPRIANNFLRRLRDFSQVSGRIVDDQFAVDILENKLQVDSMGLDAIDREYLEILDESSGGLGSDSIATQMNQGIETIEDYIEPYLLRIGFMERRRNGRWITQDGSDWVRGT